MKEIKTLYLRYNTNEILTIDFPINTRELKEVLEAFPSADGDSAINLLANMSSSIFLHTFSTILGNEEISDESNTETIKNEREYISNIVKSLNKIYYLDKDISINIKYGELFIELPQKYISNIEFILQDGTKENFNDIFKMILLTYEPNIALDKNNKYYRIDNIYNQYNIAITYKVQKESLIIGFKNTNKVSREN